MLLVTHLSSAQQTLSRPRADSTRQPGYQPPVMNGGGGGNGLNVSLSFAVLCAGDRATLVATGGDGTYTWTASTTPDVAALSSTTGNRVVVSPTAYTTYTVTSHDPTTGATITNGASVTVFQNCCPTSKNPNVIVEISGTTFSASPFLGYPTGTRFHFASTAAIHLQNAAFQPPMGSVLLMNANQDLILEGGASLNLNGVSVTAACNEMWGRLWVRGNTAGITARAAGALRSQISHSQGGVEFEEAPPGTPDLQVPLRDFTYTDFLHNDTGLKIQRTTVLGNPNDEMVECAFDSNPAYFKSPFATGSANAPHYSSYHVWFVGNGGVTWSNCRFKNALFGFHSPDHAVAPKLYVVASQFDNLLLAGVNVNNARSDGFITFDDVASTFTFPTAANVQSGAQVAAARASADVYDHASETRGIYSRNTPVRLAGTVFDQPNGPAYPDFTFAQRDKQIGVKTPRLMSLLRSRFNYLHTGVEMQEVVNSLTLNSISGNVFTACRRGIEVHGGGIAARGGSPPPLRNPTVRLPLSCNTFDRVNASRSGTSYGIYLDSDAFVTFDPLTGPAQVLTNKFLDYMAGRPGFYALFNVAPDPANLIKYTTFYDYVNTSNTLNGHKNLSALSQYVAVTGDLNYYYSGPNGQSGSVCGVGNPGLERPSTGHTGLAQLHPNPASETATLRYELAAGTRTAELRVQRGTDGQLMRQCTLNPAAQRSELNLKGWQPGVYFITLTADGNPVKTQRLLVR